MRLDLTDLRLFSLVVEHGSITAGAHAANLALASASGRITGMEEHLGVALLERSRRGVAPTAAGLSLLGHAQSIGAQVTLMEDDLRGFSAGLRGNVRLLANTAAMIELVPRSLQILLAGHPEIDVELEERASGDIAAMLASGRGDLGVAADTADLGVLETRVLRADRLTAIVPPGHQAAGAGSIAYVDLLGERFIGLAAGALHDHLLAQAARLGRRISFRVRVSSFDSVMALVAAGAGVAVIPEAALGRGGRQPVERVRLLDAWADRRLLVCARSFDRLNRAAALLLEALFESSRVTSSRQSLRVAAPSSDQE